MKGVKIVLDIGPMLYKIYKAGDQWSPLRTRYLNTQGSCHITTGGRFYIVIYKAGDQWSPLHTLPQHTRLPLRGAVTSVTEGWLYIIKTSQIL